MLRGLVRSVFYTLGSSYDIMNDFMSLNVHRLWKDSFPCPGSKPIHCIDVAGVMGDIALHVPDHACETYGIYETRVDVVNTDEVLRATTRSSPATGDRAQNQYLAESTQRFPNQNDFAQMIADAGFPIGENFEGGGGGGCWGLWGRPRALVHLSRDGQYESRSVKTQISSGVSKTIVTFERFGPQVSLRTSTTSESTCNVKFLIICFRTSECALQGYNGATLALCRSGWDKLGFPEALVSTRSPDPMVVSTVSFITQNSDREVTGRTAVTARGTRSAHNASVEKLVGQSSVVRSRVSNETK
ncbi:hypothetical protein H4582DRAFT_2197659 [Lactarius indigo]|nr:hypothetical protein H4582DRAFT_2197659 [Lactarius indigo]